MKRIAFRLTPTLFTHSLTFLRNDRGNVLLEVGLYKSDRKRVLNALLRVLMNENVTGDMASIFMHRAAVQGSREHCFQARC